MSKDFSKYRRPAATERYDEYVGRGAQDSAEMLRREHWQRLLGVKRSDGSGGMPLTPLDWALHWAGKGIHVFPCEQHLGTPLLDPWYTAATTDPSKIIAWWSATPDAD